MQIHQKKIAIVGTGSFSQALGHAFADRGEMDVLLLGRNPENVQAINDGNLFSWRDVRPPIGGKLAATTDWQRVLDHSDLLALSIPAAAVLQFAQTHNVSADHKILSLIKGPSFDPSNPADFQTITSAVGGVWGSDRLLAAWAGPNLAHEIINGGIIRATIASQTQGNASMLADRLWTKGRAENALVEFLTPGQFEITDQLEAVQLAGIWKNAYSIAVGIYLGLNWENKTHSLGSEIISKSLKELLAIIDAKTNDVESRNVMYSAAGYADFIASSCILLTDKDGNPSFGGRNQKFGFEIAQGIDPSSLIDANKTIEGHAAIRCLRAFAIAHGLKLPLLEMTYQVVINRMDPRIVFSDENILWAEERFDTFYAMGP